MGTRINFFQRKIFLLPRASNSDCGQKTDCSKEHLGGDLDWSVRYASNNTNGKSPREKKVRSLEANYSVSEEQSVLEMAAIGDQGQLSWPWPAKLAELQSAAGCSLRRDGGDYKEYGIELYTRLIIL